MNTTGEKWVEETQGQEANGPQTEDGKDRTGQAWPPPRSLYSGWGGAQEPLWSTLSPVNAGIPLEPLQVTECFLRPEAVRPLNISPQCHAFPSRITAPSLHNCRLPPGCTMSKHVVLTVGGGGCVSCPEHGDGQQELGEQAWWRPLLLGQSGCCCVTDTLHSCLDAAPAPPLSTGASSWGGQDGRRNRLSS